MKRILALIFVISLLFSICSCALKTNETDPTAIIGKWMNPNYTEFKEYVTDEVPADIFYKIYYEFYEDGKGCTYVEGYEDKKTYIVYSYDAVKDILTFTFENGNSVSVSCEIKGDQMRVIEGENQAVFYRQ